MVHDVYPLMVL